MIYLNVYLGIVKQDTAQKMKILSKKFLVEHEIFVTSGITPFLKKMQIIVETLLIESRERVYKNFKPLLK